MVAGKAKGKSAAGKSGKAKTASRHRKVLRATQTPSKPSIRRIARRGGCRRISSTVYGEARSVLRSFLNQVLRDAIVYTTHARRVTVTPTDVRYALKRSGRKLYGY
ncbi:hypothetical protein PCE1_005005 [Barthelona sp. PCE]